MVMKILLNQDLAMRLAGQYRFAIDYNPKDYSYFSASIVFAFAALKERILTVIKVINIDKHMADING